MYPAIIKTFVSACEAGGLAEANGAANKWKSSEDGMTHSPSDNANHPLRAGLVTASEKGHADIVKL